MWPSYSILLKETSSGTSVLLLLAKLFLLSELVLNVFCFLCCRNTRRKQGTNRAERQSLQVKGIFYQNSLRPPKVPAATAFSPSSMSSARKLWSAAVGVSPDPDWHPVTLCAPVYPTPPAYSSRATALMKSGLLTQQGEQGETPERGESASSDTTTTGNNHSTSQHSVRTPTNSKRIATPPPQSYHCRGSVDASAVVLHYSRRPHLYSISQSEQVT